MSSEIQEALIGVLPQLLLLIILLGLAFVFRDTLRERLRRGEVSFSLFGFRFDLKPDAVHEALTRQGRQSREDLPDAGAIGLVGLRARRSRAILAGTRLLWVDDHPEGNRVERFVLNAMGIFTEPVRSTNEAAESLMAGIGGAQYDVVISDIDRDDGTDGKEIIGVVGSLQGPKPRLIFYVSKLESSPDGKPTGPPPGSFGITSRPDELWHLVMDAIDRDSPIRPPRRVSRSKSVA